MTGHIYTQPRCPRCLWRAKVGGVKHTGTLVVEVKEGFWKCVQMVGRMPCGWRGTL